MNKYKVVVVGGGYAGLRATLHLSKNPQFEIYLFDKKPYHFMQTDVYDLIANEKDFAGVSVDLFTYAMGFDNVTFCNEEVIDVDCKQRKIITQEQRMKYDYLIIAVGARTRFARDVKGLYEYGHGIKSLHRALYFKQKFEHSLFTKIDQNGVSCTPLNIVVAGGGLSGVEIAAQMASFAQEFFEKNHFICRKLNIVLVNSGKEILQGMDSKLVQKAHKRLLSLGVEIKTEVRVASVCEEHVALSNGEKLPIDFLIFAGGIEPNGLIYNLSLAKTERGFLQTLPTLQTPQYKEVFVIGDATTLYDTHNNPLAPTADIAEQMGELVAKNIIALTQNKPLAQHNISSRGILIALGRGYASAKVFGLYFHGYLAYCAKKLIEWSYFRQLDAISKKGCKKIFDN